MTAQELYEWLGEIPEKDRKSALCFLEVALGSSSMITPRFFKTGKLKPFIHFMHK